MATLGERFQQLNFNAGGELPDHLPVLLRFTALLTDTEIKELTEYCLLGPVKQMCESLTEKDNPYTHLLKAVFAALKAD